MEIQIIVLANRGTEPVFVRIGAPTPARGGGGDNAETGITVGTLGFASLELAGTEKYFVSIRR